MCLLLQLQEVLRQIEAGNLMPPLVVLSTLAKNPKLKLSVVKDYIARQLKAESAHIDEDRSRRLHRCGRKCRTSKPRSAFLSPVLRRGDQVGVAVIVTVFGKCWICV